jgi:cytochrome c
MIVSLDCTTCHKINEKNIGPAYTDVAKKYETTDANIDMLAQKVIKGGSGNWGSVPMTPHPAVSVDSAKEMVRYILNLKNAK